MDRQGQVSRLRDEFSSLELPGQLSIESFCDVVAERRGKPMLLLPIPNPHKEDQPNGAWLETDALDLVFYADGTSPMHRDTIIGHELGHMWYGHPSDEINIDAFTEALPDLSTRTILRMMGRHSYSRDEERDAELFGHLLKEHVTSGRISPPPGAETWMTRLLAALQNPREP